jgi:hypothetical protein
MTAPFTPMRWPAAWTDVSTLDLIKGSAIDYLLIEKDDRFEPIRTQARQAGLRIGVADETPSGVTLIKGLWPGVKTARSDAGRVIAGPTGDPWVDSNGWQIQLAAALTPETAVWVTAAPPENFRSSAGPYLTAVADSGAYGGRWVISLDGQLASGLSARRSEALGIWKKIAAAAGFFAQRKAWAAYTPITVVGVASDFSGPNEFFSHELLNLLARAGQNCRILPKGRVAASSLEGLRAVIYADTQEPPPALRKQILSFVSAGGTLIASPQWGAVPGAPAKPDDESPAFSVRALGKGRVAMASASARDPYQWANDSVVLVSHRYDLVRFWNGGATGSFCAMSPDRKHAVAHLLFYANRGPDAASVRIAGRWKSVQALTADGPLEGIESEHQPDSIEVHLPQAPQYVALELET